MKRSSSTNKSTELLLRPPLKWAGGKRWIVKHVMPFWKNNRRLRFIEPLCGGLAVTLGLTPERALLNDINPHLMNFYLWLKQGFFVSVEMRNDSSLYYSHRERFNQLTGNGGTGSREAAELFYYLNRTGYNGLCRFNSRGKFNVPFGKYKTINYLTDFTRYVGAFHDWEFTCKDFEELSLEKNDFIYADPPYDVGFTQYSKENFNWEDQVRLGQWIAQHSGPAMLSNQATPRIVSLYKELGFHLKFLEGPRRINCKGDRTPAQEVLAMKGIR